MPNGTVVYDERATSSPTSSARAPATSWPRAARVASATPASRASSARPPASRSSASPARPATWCSSSRASPTSALVGYPSAGKSSLIAALSAARPKIADYPFTTLVPNLGVVEAGGTTFTVADVPGLIPGAHAGKGLGLEFLRHVERCAVLVHVLDCATLEPGRDPVSDLEVLEQELPLYKDDVARLNDRPRLVVLNKVDVPEARDLAELVTPRARGARLPGVRAVGGEPRGAAAAGVRDGDVVAADRAQRPVEEATRIVLRPRAVDDLGFTVERPRRRAATSCAATSRSAGCVQTDFHNEEAVGYLADRLARLGVEKALAEAGAEPGDAVTIGDVSFDWQPTELRAVLLRHARPGRPVRGPTAPAPTSAACRRTCAAAERMGLDKEELLTRLTGRPRVSRAAIAGARRLVVKVGSSSLTTAAGGLDPARLDALVDALAARGGQLVLVSSGAIAAGLAPLGLTRRPRDLATQQAAASVGQLLLVAALRDRVRPARPHGRAGAAHRRRRRAPRALPQRPAHARPAARARRRAGRQRERHRRDRGDPLRRQRPARRARRARRAADAWCCSPTSTGSTTATRGGRGRRWSARCAVRGDLDGWSRRHRRAGLGTGGMATKVDAAADRHRRGRPGALACHPDVADALAGAAGTLFHPTGDPRARPACSGSPTPPPPAAGRCWTPARSRRWSPGAPRCSPPAWRPSRASSSPGTRSTWSVRTASARPRARRLRLRRIARRLLGRPDLPRLGRREIVHRDDMVLV